MLQTLVLAYSAHRQHSQISMRNLSLSLSHKHVEIRACVRQRTPYVVFWLKLESVRGFKNSYSVQKQLHSGMYLENEKAFVVCRHRSERYGSIVWTATQN